MIRKPFELPRPSGVARLLYRSAGYVYRHLVRPVLPTASYTQYNGVRIARARKVFDSQVPLIFKPLGLDDVPEYESALVRCIRQYVREGDRVVVVGGGEGVTAVVAAQQAGLSGSVLCYEGAKQSAEAVRGSARLNGVASRVAVTHAVVAKSISVYGAQCDHGTVVIPSAIPACDVLELDCEGAETQILQEMGIRPRVILVETHGVFGASTLDVEILLSRLSYAVIRVGVAEERFADVCARDDIYVLAAVLQNSEPRRRSSAVAAPECANRVPPGAELPVPEPSGSHARQRE